jgi:hypothetical protein
MSKDVTKIVARKLNKAIEAKSQWYTVRSILGYSWAIFYILLRRNLAQEKLERVMQ